MRDLLEDHDSPFFQSLPDIYRKNSDRYCILESRGRNRSKIKNEMDKKEKKVNKEICL